LADDYFSDGADEKAYAELSLLSREPALHEGHCEMAADVLAERGDLSGALKWYDRAVARLTPETLDELRDSGSWLQSSSIMLRNRRDVRRRLGLPPDAMDETTPDVPLGPLADFEDIRDRAATSRTPREVRMLVFQRDERARARRRWPDAFAEPHEEYFPAAERRWRELSDTGVPSIRVVPMSVCRSVRVRRPRRSLPNGRGDPSVLCPDDSSGAGDRLGAGAQFPVLVWVGDEVQEMLRSRPLSSRRFPQFWAISEPFRRYCTIALRR